MGNDIPHDPPVAAHPRGANPDPFRLLLDQVREYAIFMLDTAGHVTSWNEGARRIKGYTADEIIGRHFSCFYPAEDH